MIEYDLRNQQLCEENKNISLKGKECGELSSKILLSVKKENQNFWHTKLKACLETFLLQFKIPN